MKWQNILYLYLINEHWTLCPISQECSCLLPRRKNSCLPDVSVHQLQPTRSSLITKNVQSLIITTNNPLGHQQLQRMFSLSSLSLLTHSVILNHKKVQSLIITSNNPIDHPKSQSMFSISSSTITTHLVISHTQSKRMFSLSSLTGREWSYYWLSQSKAPFAVASIFQSQRNEREYSESRLYLCAFGGILIRERYIFLLCVNPSTLLTLRYPQLL